MSEGGIRHVYIASQHPVILMVNATEHVVGDVTLGRETEKTCQTSGRAVVESLRQNTAVLQLCYTTHLFNQSDPSLTRAKDRKHIRVVCCRRPCYCSQLRTCSTSPALENICLTWTRTGCRACTHTEIRTPVLSCMEIKTIFFNYLKNSFNGVRRLNKREVYVVVRDLCIA